jgi:hypothetical protein
MHSVTCAITYWWWLLAVQWRALAAVTVLLRCWVKRGSSGLCPGTSGEGHASSAYVCWDLNLTLVVPVVWLCFVKQSVQLDWST